MKKFISLFVIVVMLFIMALSVSAASINSYVGPTGKTSAVSLTYGETYSTAYTGSNSYATFTYAKAYIYYDNGEFISSWNSAYTSAVTATVNHTSYPSGASYIDSYKSYHRITIDGVNYNKSLST